MSGLAALDRKLLRTLRKLWAQEAAIAAVLACGVAIFLMAAGLSRALDDTREAYYDRQGFADVFAAARRAPLPLEAEIAALPGVTAVQTRVTGQVILQIPGRVETAVGRVLSLPEAGPPRLNRPLLVSGRWPEPGRAGEVVVNAAFAEANGFRPGDGFRANLNGRQQALTITGTAQSPEFIYTLGPGALMPDDESFGILWMPRRAAEAAFGLQGAFNDVALRLARGGSEEATIAALDRLLAPYGGTGAHGRDQQMSHAFIDAEIAQLKSMALVMPPVFLGITVFLLHMVIGRIIALERGEIGLLKAIGYSKREIGVHYLMLAGLIASAGVLAGWALGWWLARQMAVIYAEFFAFPFLIFSMPPSAYATAGALGLAAALAGAGQSALRAARLPPAVAMAPPAPPNFRRTALDRLLAALRLSQPSMMILRGLMRWPLRAALTGLGLAMAAAVMVAATFFDDALAEIIDLAFYQSNRQHATLVFTEDLPIRVVEEVRALPGVLVAEPMASAPVVLRHGARSKRLALEARPEGAELARVVDRAGHPVALPDHGVMLSERLAEVLALQPGDMVTVEFLTGRREAVRLPVTGLVRQYFGLGAYMEIGALDRLLRRAPAASAVNVTLDPAARDRFEVALTDLPALAGKVMLLDNRRSFEATIAENVTRMTVVYAALGVVITLGVAYNGARVQLSERARELASLRILGFGRGEVAYILMGEIALLAVLAQPVGWAVGAAIAAAMVQGFSSDLYTIPLVLKPATFAVASLVVLGATAAALLVVRRRLDRLDLIAVMKTRE